MRSLGQAGHVFGGQPVRPEPETGAENGAHGAGGKKN